MVKSGPARPTPNSFHLFLFYWTCVEGLSKAVYYYILSTKPKLQIIEEQLHTNCNMGIKYYEHIKNDIIYMEKCSKH